MLVTLAGAAWLHIFHPAAGDAGVNGVAAQIREHARGAPSRLLTGLWAGIAGPAAEELLFRGLIFNVLAQARKRVPARYSVAVVVLAAMISSLLFALWHGDAADTLPDRFAMGMILCAVYWWTASLLPALAVHAAWNLSWFQVAALGARPLLLGAWPAPDIAIILVLLAILCAAGAASCWRLTPS